MRANFEVSCEPGNLPPCVAALVERLFPTVFCLATFLPRQVVGRVGSRSSSLLCDTQQSLTMQSALLAVLLTPTSGWVLFSPVRRTLSYKAYEDASNTPWVDPSSFNLDIVSLRWGLPPSSYSDEALASGISFALHRDFCERLMPLFPERTDIGRFFLSCDDLRDTVKRAADTWAINHKKINFIDRTDACRDVTGTQSCPYAELFIVPDDIERSDSSSNDLAVRAPFFIPCSPIPPYSFSRAHALFLLISRRRRSHTTSGRFALARTFGIVTS